MGFMKSNISRQYIAVADSAKNQILYKWPDENIRKFSTVIVEPDQMALFASRGVIIGALGPGRWELDAAELPILGNLIDYFTGGDAYRAELYFVGTREYTGNRFGGRLDEIMDPVSSLIVTLRAFGEYSLKVTDLSKLILNLTGTINVSDNAGVTNWVNEMLFKVLRQATTTKLASGEWAILGLSAHLSQIEEAALADAKAQLDTYGLEIVRMGNIDINLSDDDNEKLKKFANDVAYSRLAGSFTQAAAAQAMQGAGEGMAKGGEGAGGAFVGMGMGMGVAGGVLSSAAGPTPAGEVFGGRGYGPSAGVNDEHVAAGASTGNAGSCASCGQDLRAGAKFCDGCGTRVDMVPKCSKCGQDLRAGAKFCDGCGQMV